MPRAAFRRFPRPSCHETRSNVLPHCRQAGRAKEGHVLQPFPINFRFFSRYRQ